LTILEKIYICNETKIESLRGLSEISSLKELFLNDFDNDYNFIDLYGLSNLESFKVHTTGFIDFNGVEKLASLRFLEVHRCRPKNADYLSNAKSLQTLDLGIDKEVDDFKFIENFIDLEYINLYNIESDPSANAHTGRREYQKEIDMFLMRKLASLKTVYLGGFVIDNIAILNELPLLKDVYLCDCFILPNNDHKVIIDNDTWVRRDFTPDEK
jgi:hypothetical protein